MASNSTSTLSFLHPSDREIAPNPLTNNIPEPFIQRSSHVGLSSRNLQFCIHEVIYPEDDEDDEGQTNIHRTVYRGILSGDPSEQPQSVVCKLEVDIQDKNDSVENEIRTYETSPLKDLQGTDAPVLWGGFSGYVSGKRSACILLEDCGQPLLKVLKVASAEFVPDLQ